MNIDDLTDFLLKNNKDYYSKDKDKIRRYLKKHIEYRTIMVTKDDKGITALARWNWLDSNTVFVCDVVVREDKRRMGALKKMIENGKKKHPNFQYIVFERLGKYPNRKRRIYSVDCLLGGKK